MKNECWGIEISRIDKNDFFLIIFIVARWRKKIRHLFESIKLTITKENCGKLSEKNSCGSKFRKIYSISSDSISIFYLKSICLMTCKRVIYVVKFKEFNELVQSDELDDILKAWRHSKRWKLIILFSDFKNSLILLYFFKLKFNSSKQFKHYFQKKK